MCVIYPPVLRVFTSRKRLPHLLKTALVFRQLFSDKRKRSSFLVIKRKQTINHCFKFPVINSYLPYSVHKRRTKNTPLWPSSCFNRCAFGWEHRMTNKNWKKGRRSYPNLSTSLLSPPFPVSLHVSLPLDSWALRGLLHSQSTTLQLRIVPTVLSVFDENVKRLYFMQN